MRALSVVFVVACAAGLEAVAGAQPGDRNSIDIKVRLQGTEAWLDELDAEPGAVVEVGAFYFRDRGYSLAGAIHNIIANNWDAAAGDTAEIVDNPNSALHPDGRVSYGPGLGFNFGGQRQDIYTTGIDVGRMRVSAFGNPNNVPAGGISVRQNCPFCGGGHITADGVLAYRFNITVGDGVGRVIPLDAPREDMASFSVYMTSGSTNSTPILQFYDGTDGAMINVVPGVPSFLVLGIGAAGILWRRRSAPA